jgi:hypothetical protein
MIAEFAFDEAIVVASCTLEYKELRTGTEVMLRLLAASTRRTDEKLASTTAHT